MAPEYGATCGFFPVDDETLRYLRNTGRTADEVDLVERYMKEQGLFRTRDSAEPVFTDTIELDLSTVEPSLAGPKRPQDRVPLKAMKESFRKSLVAPVKDRGFGLGPDDLRRTAAVEMKGVTSTLAQHTGTTPQILVRNIADFERSYATYDVELQMKDFFAFDPDLVMTGWRIGYLIGNAEVIGAASKIQSQSTSNPTSIAQWASVPE